MGYANSRDRIMKNVFLALAIIGTLVPYYFFVQHFGLNGYAVPDFIAGVFATPAASGASGPTTTRSTRDPRARATIAPGSATSTARLRPLAASFPRDSSPKQDFPA